MKNFLARVLAMGAVGTVAVVAATPASAAPSSGSNCAAIGTVYETSAQPIVAKTENDPIDTSYGPLYIDVVNDGQAHDGRVRLGGNGLRPSSTPDWDIFSSNGGHIGKFGGNRAGDNCVSNEKNFTVKGAAGDLYFINSNYDAGNSGRQVRGQHLVFVQFY